VLPAIHRGNVGTLTPDDLLLAVGIFEATFGSGDD
jgi:hypothetical protein